LGFDDSELQVFRGAFRRPMRGAAGEQRERGEDEQGAFHG
jgi:hypothetical protein